MFTYWLACSTLLHAADAPHVPSFDYAQNVPPVPSAARVTTPSYRALSGARTPLSPKLAHDHLIEAFRNVVGRGPSTSTLSILWAQWALETGRGRKMYGFNFGGLKTDQGGRTFMTKEGFGARERETLQRFRTYATAAEGAADYVRTLAIHFPEALRAAARGSADRFVKALLDGDYFTGSPKHYARAIDLLAREHLTAF